MTTESSKWGYFRCLALGCVDFVPTKLNIGGPPLGYFDWNMIQQAAWGGVESAFLFGAASLAMEFAFRQEWISKFD